MTFLQESFHCIEAICIRAIARVRKVQLVVEQPKSSVMFGLDLWAAVIRELSLKTVSTYMGCFQHFMMKPTILLGSLRYLGWSLQLNSSSVSL